MYPPCCRPMSLIAAAQARPQRVHGVRHQLDESIASCVPRRGRVLHHPQLVRFQLGALISRRLAVADDIEPTGHVVEEALSRSGSAMSAENAGWDSIGPGADSPGLRVSLSSSATLPIGTSPAAPAIGGAGWRELPGGRPGRAGSRRAVESRNPRCAPDHARSVHTIVPCPLKHECRPALFGETACAVNPSVGVRGRAR